MDASPETGLLYDFDLRFPPLSRTVAEVSDLLSSNGMPDTDRLIQIVHMDPLVVASVLKRINSAFYGMRKQFQDIRKAILMIGFIEVCNIVLASGYVGLRKTVQNNVQAAIIERIMRVSIGSGYYADLLARQFQLPNKSSAFTAGLLHSIGRFVLLYNLPEAYERMFREHEEHYIPTWEHEEQHLGIDHTSIGSLAAEHWNFPPLIASLIESYKKPGQLVQPDQRIIALILLACTEISTQLCSNYEVFSKQADATELSDAEIDDAIPFAIDFPPALFQLAENRNCTPEELIETINTHQIEALHYIEMMIKV